MDRAELAEPPLSAELVASWHAYLDAWSSGRRRAALSLAESLTAAVGGLDGPQQDDFGSWLCARLFDDGDGWSGQFGGGLAYKNGAFDRPIQYALSMHPLTSRVVIPHVIAACRSAGGGRPFRWLYQSLIGLRYRLPPDVGSGLDETLHAIFGPKAEPLDALRRASFADERAKQWLAEIATVE